MNGHDCSTVTIAFFLPHLRHGGLERLCVTLIRNLRRERFRPLVIVQKREGEFLNLLEGTDIVALRNRRAPICILELASLLQRHRAQVIYTGTTATNIYASVAARLCGCRSVISEHTPLAENAAEAKWRRLRMAAVKLTYPLADLVVAPLPQIGVVLRNVLGRRCPPFRCLPNPVVDHILPPRLVPDQARRFVSVGRLAEVKRFDLMIRAFAILHDRFPDATLQILGEGPERPKLEELVRSLNLGSSVLLPGYAQDVSRRIGDADLYLCTSQREGFGNAIVEAMATGVPVVSLDCPVGPEVILQGGTAGRLVREHTAESFARAVIEVAENAQARLSYAAAGSRVAGGFTVPAAVEAYDDMFAGLAGSYPGR